MNATDLLDYVHEWFLKKVNTMPEDQWDTPGATGEWSCKDILSHITSYEVALVPVLEEFVEKGKSETDPFPKDHQQNNTDQTAKRRSLNYKEILSELNEANKKAMELLSKIPKEKQAENGLLNWYGEKYSLEDYLMYRYFGHKREHGTQIDVFIDHLNN
jgi:hypothetical protein